MRLYIKHISLSFSLLIPVAGFAQPYSIDWYELASGGGASTGGVYSVSGTIGQHDVGGLMTGANYSLMGGFWSFIAVVQTAGVPNLTIAQDSNNVTVSWSDTGTYTLLQNSSLTSGSWTTNHSIISTSNGTNSITLTLPAGRLFFRLKQ